MLDLTDRLVSYVAFDAFGLPVTVVEVVAFVSGAACVFGVARQKLWSWPVGILNNLAYAVLFLSVGLYAETGLQAVFAVIAVYGWWNWLYGGPRVDSLPVRRESRVEVVGLVAAAVVVTAVLTLVLSRGTDSVVPFWDSLVVALSLVATYGQAKKLLNSWAVWIAVDLIAIPLYLTRGLLLSSLLYVVFLALCIYGYRGWRRSFDVGHEQPTLFEQTGSAPPR